MGKIKCRVRAGLLIRQIARALPFEPGVTLRSPEHQYLKEMDSTGFEPVAFTLQT